MEQGAYINVIVGLGLLIVGFLSLRRVKDMSQYVFASIPFLCGIQQLIEAVIFSTTPPQSYGLLLINTTALYLFLSYILVLWPFWVPLSVFLLEKDIFRKFFLALLCIWGAGVSLYGIITLLQHGAVVKPLSGNLFYYITTPTYADWHTTLFYMVPVIVPFFISSYRMLWIAGLLISASYIGALWYKPFFFISMEAFYTSLISIYLYVVIWKITQRKRSYVELF